MEALRADDHHAGLPYCRRSCGGSSSASEKGRSASEILNDARQNLAYANTVRIHGPGTLNGLAIAADVVAGQGVGGGSITLGPLNLQLVLHGTDLFIRANASVWSRFGCAEDAQALAGGWVKATTDQPVFAALGRLLDLLLIARNLENVSVVKDGITTINGQDAIALKTTDSRQPRTIYYVAANGTPDLVGERDGTNSGLFSLDRYDKAQTPSQPIGATPLDNYCRVAA